MSAQLIPLPWCAVPMTKNQVRRLHYRDEAKLRATLLTEARWAIKAARTKPMWTAEFVLHYRPKNNQRRDADGLAPTKSIVLDALVAEGVLTDDSFREVPFSGERIHPPIKGLPAVMWAELSAPGEVAGDAA